MKRRNKARLGRRLRERAGVDVDPAAMFDVQVKRIHEYKRQHLNVLHVITRYRRLLDAPAQDIVARVFVFGGKAAPGYRMAKLIIRLINGVAAVYFLAVGAASLPEAGLMAVASLVGGYAGAHLAQRLRAGVMRALVVSYGLLVALRLFQTG